MEVSVLNEVNKMLEGLKWDSLSKVCTDAIKMTLRELRLEARSLFDSLPIKKNDKKMPRSSVGAGTFYESVSDGSITGTVSILRKGRLLKLFEKGTNLERVTRLGYRRGLIKPYKYFKHAQENYNVDEMFRKHLQDQIDVLKLKNG